MRSYTADEAERDFIAACSLYGAEAALIDSLGAAAERLTPPRPAVTTLAAALWYAQQGLHVFPIQQGQKIPHPRTRGCKDATTDPQTIHEWWARWPGSNVAIATGHVVDVIDFDGLPGHLAWTQRFGDGWGGLDILATASTPRPGGVHKYIASTGKRGNKAALLPGVDVRGLGGYVLAAPSVLDDRPGQHPGTYRFLGTPRLVG